MNAEIISVGDELVRGQRLDTNSQWISQRLGDLGVVVQHHTTIGDELADNIRAFQIAAGRADLVVITGGLGPTADDLTREALAVAFDRPLEFRSEAMEHIENLFRNRGRPMPERNRVQAYFPATSTIIPNPFGTAPGIDLTVEPQESHRGRNVEPGSDSKHQCRFFALPGVPAEMMEMLTATVEPAISQDLGADQRPWFFHSIKLFGLGESDVEKQVPDLIARDRLPRVGITVSKATITLRIAHQSESQAAFLTEIQPTVDLIEKEFGEFIFGTGEDELQDVVHHLLRTQAKTLSLLEIGSGPWIAHLLSLGFDPSPSYGLQSASWVPHLENGLVQSSIGKDFRNKVILDTLDLKELLCNIALQHRIDTNTDYTLVAGVYPASSSFNPAEGLPNCKFQVAIAKPKGAVHHSVHRILGHPELFYQRLAKTALNTLRKELLDDQS